MKLLLLLATMLAASGPFAPIERQIAELNRGITRLEKRQAAHRAMRELRARVLADSLQLEAARANMIASGRLAPAPAWSTVSSSAAGWRYFTGTLPTLGSVRCSDDTVAIGGSWYHLSVLFQKQAPSPFAPPWWPKYAPKWVAASNDSPVGRIVTVAVPDTFSYGTLIFRVVREGGHGLDSSSCDSKIYLPSRLQ